VIDPDKSRNVKLSYAGATIIYLNKKKRYADTLQITGPTTAKLKIMVRITQVKCMSVFRMIDVNMICSFFNTEIYCVLQEVHLSEKNLLA